MVKKMLSVMEQMLWLCAAEAGAAVVLDTGSHRLGNTCRGAVSCTLVHTE